MEENLSVVRLGQEKEVKPGDTFFVPKEATHIAIGRGKIVAIKARFTGNKKSCRWHYVPREGKAVFVLIDRFLLEKTSGNDYKGGLFWMENVTKEVRLKAISL